jgi:glutathione S-transferase
MALRLIIGNKTFSSWSLRPWIALKVAGLPFTEQRVLLGRDDTYAQLAAASPTGKVPVLIDDQLVIAESLAILEYVAEITPDAQLLPKDRVARALCRAAATEMHAGFQALRNHCPMNLRRVKQPRASGLTAQVEKDIARIQTIWNECRERFGAGGPFLFGHFTIADAMYAPVATRFMSYDLPRDAVSDAYIKAIYSAPAFKVWQADAALETESYPSTEEVD